MTIEVFLDTSADPPVTVTPGKKDKDKGKDTITWKPGKDHEFTFVSLEFADSPACFGVPQIKDNGKKITVEDDNSDGSCVGDFPYTLVVELDGHQYSTSASTDASGTSSASAMQPDSTSMPLSAGEPTIRNKPN